MSMNEMYKRMVSSFKELEKLVEERKLTLSEELFCQHIKAELEKLIKHFKEKSI